MADIAELEIRVSDTGTRQADEALTRLERTTDKTRTGFSRLQASVITANQALALVRQVTSAAQAGFDALFGSAIRFESGFTGVRKTVDGTAADLARLSTQLQALDRVLPASTTEILGVAASAGQLGIQTENIAEFTRTMIELGVSTNLSADEAATALARLANITQLPQDQFDRLGSTIVALGNNLATTEREITEMALRIAGAGQTVGLTEAQILAFAAALSSLGIEAESGGTAISRVFIEIAKSVETGDKRLALFAKTAGESTSDFARAFRTDAAGATQAFIEGLGRLQRDGGSVIQVLDALKLENIRVSDALRRASSGGDLLSRALALSGDAWRENTALTREAELRFADTEQQLLLLQKAITGTGRDIGSEFLPEVKDTIQAMREWIEVNEEWIKADVVGTLRDLGEFARSIASLQEAPIIKQLVDATPSLKSTAQEIRTIAALLRGVGEIVRDVVDFAKEPPSPAVVTIGTQLIATTQQAADEFHRLKEAAIDFNDRRLTTDEEERLLSIAEQTVAAYRAMKRAAEDATGAAAAANRNFVEQLVTSERAPAFVGPPQLAQFGLDVPQVEIPFASPFGPQPTVTAGGGRRGGGLPSGGGATGTGTDELARFAEQVTEDTRTALEAFEAFKAQLTQALDAGAITGETYTRAIAKATQEVQEADPLIQAWQRHLEDAAVAGEQLFQDTRTAAERYTEEQRRINALFAEGAIDSETQARAIADLGEQYAATAVALRESVDPAFAFARAMENINRLAAEHPDIITPEIQTRAIDEAFERINRTADDGYEKLIEATRGFGDHFTDTLAKGLAEGRFEFQEFLQALVQDLLKFSLQELVTDRILDMFKKSVIDPLKHGRFFGGGDQGLTQSVQFSGAQDLASFLGVLDIVGGELTATATDTRADFAELTHGIQGDFTALFNSLGTAVSNIFNTIFGGGGFDVAGLFQAIGLGAVKGGVGGAAGGAVAEGGFTPAGGNTIFTAHAGAFFHAGGLRTNEIPAILEKGELVVSRDDTAMLRKLLTRQPTIRRFHEGGMVDGGANLAALNWQPPRLAGVEAIAAADRRENAAARGRRPVTVNVTFAPNISSFDPATSQQLLIQQARTIEDIVYRGAQRGGRLAQLPTRDGGS